MVLETLSAETAIIFVAFVIVVFVLYRTMRVMFKAFMVAAAAYSFPWLAAAAGLPIQANVQTSMEFAALGVSLFMVYQFFHFVVYFFKLLSLPFRYMAGHKRRERQESADHS